MLVLHFSTFVLCPSVKMRSHLESSVALADGIILCNPPVILLLWGRHPSHLLWSGSPMGSVFADTLKQDTAFSHLVSAASWIPCPPVHSKETHKARCLTSPGHVTCTSIRTLTQIGTTEHQWRRKTTGLLHPLGRDAASLETVEVLILPDTHFGLWENFKKLTGHSIVSSFDEFCEALSMISCLGSLYRKCLHENRWTDIFNDSICEHQNVKNTLAFHWIASKQEVQLR